MDYRNCVFSSFAILRNGTAPGVFEISVGMITYPEDK